MGPEGGEHFLASLLGKPTLAPGYNELVGPGARTGGAQVLQHIRFGILNLEVGEEHVLETGGEEAVCVLLAGRCEAAVGGGPRWTLGPRPSVFAGKAWAVYLPPGCSGTFRAEGSAQLAVARAESAGGGPARLVTPDDVVERTAGKDNYTRLIHNILVGPESGAGRVLIGETLNQPGQWSSYPPHRHEEQNPPDEVRLEELYYFKVDPPQGFGFQRVYTDDRSLDEAYVIENDTFVMIPRGYHPVSAAPGYRIYYLWVLAGGSLEMAPRDDPDHQWVLEAG